MANNHNVIDLINLDPNTNKTSFINYLQTQSRFQGYNFEGSDMSVLLDTFMINEFRMGFFLNMAISEGFLDSAQLFDSVKSHAKDLNYTPRSITSASANVTVNFTATGESQPYLIPKGSTFSTQVKNHNFTFSTNETITVASPNNSFSFTTNIYEGVYVKDSYVYSPITGVPTRFSLTNANTDTSSLVVSVFGNNALIGQSYNLVDSLLDLTGNSYVYFLQCSAANGAYEVLFGDGIFGFQPLTGSLIILDYRIASGSLSNGAGRFNISFDPTNNNELTGGSPTVTTNTVAAGGAAAETIETTRFYAPRWFQVQERCIVDSDYEIVLKQQYPEINAVNAYSGTTLSPPQYGKVIIAVDLNNIEGLPTSKINEYTAFLQGRVGLTTQIQFVSPQFTYIGVYTTVQYNTNVTTDTDNLIKTIVQSAISNYNATNLNDFDVTFYFSPFTDVIDEADASIVDNITEVNMYKKIQPNQAIASYYLNYAVPLMNTTSQLPSTYANTVAKTISSTTFTYQGNLSQLDDNGIGTIRIMNIVKNNFIFAANVGTVDYTTGIVKLNFAVDSYSGDNLLVYALPAIDNISCNQNTILSISPDQVFINVEPVAL